MIEEKDVVEIDLWKLFRFYVKKWKTIFFSSLLTAAAAFLVTTFLMTPMYRADVTVYVNNVNSSEPIEYISGSNLAAAQHLVNTYVNIITSDSVLNRVISAGELDYTANQLRPIIKAVQVEDTELFTVSVQHENPKMAAHIANTIADVAPTMISGFVEGSSTKIIDRAAIPQNPASPNPRRNVFMGGLIGALLAGIAMTLKYLFDFHLQDEKDVEQYFDAPVLGVIPSYKCLDMRKYDTYSNDEHQRRDR